MYWLMLQKLEHREQRIVLEELLGAVRQESERVERLEQAIRDAVPEWSLAEVVTALQAIRAAPAAHSSSVLIGGVRPTGSMFQSGRLAGISDRLPSGSAARRWWMLRRLMVLITASALPSKA